MYRFRCFGWVEHVCVIVVVGLIDCNTVNISSLYSSLWILSSTDFFHSKEALPPE